MTATDFFSFRQSLESIFPRRLLIKREGGISYNTSTTRKCFSLLFLEDQGKMFWPPASLMLPSSMQTTALAGDHPLKHQAKLFCMSPPDQPAGIYLGEVRRQIEELPPPPFSCTQIIQRFPKQRMCPPALLTAHPQFAPSLCVFYPCHALHLCLQPRDLHVPSPSP